ncbi:ankyrin repeat domain-containing protein 17-like [Mytilus trossulus]|uniref:ankyrin repeat domain-containing protein 17-like n=1 Tax=Mytilus trossulus TaxID=6551 RepID=UPI0030063439
MATFLSQEDINFLRLAGLLIRVAPRAVRRKFDFEFHPEQLQQFLREKRGKIDDLRRNKRVITLAQYDLLYPRGSTGVLSDMFDVSLMACLLRHFTDLDIQESLPVKINHSVAADISRIKFYRNSIVHSDSGKVDEDKFLEIWNCVTEAILRLAPEMKQEIDALISSSLTNVTDIIDCIRLEKQLKKTNQHMVTINKKLETLEIEKNNITEIQQRTLKEWRNNGKKYIPTSATMFILESLNKTTGVIITGSPGCGKSAVAHHVALELEKEKYDIIPCDDPSGIIMHFTKDKFQVFVIDDVCGKFSLNQQKAEAWEQKDCKLSMLIESCNLNDDDDENDSKSTTLILHSWQIVTTALSATCLNGHTEVAQLLLDNKADINSRDTYGQTALHSACQNGHTETVKILMEFGMNVNQKNKNGRTPLYVACKHGCYDTVKYLLDLNDQALISRVDTTIKNDKGFSVLHIACFKGHLEVVKLLIDVGMNLNDTTTINVTPLYMACYNGHYETVKYLLHLNGKTSNSRVDTTIKQKDGLSILHIACFKGHLEVVKLLIDVGMNLNDTTNAGSTPLHMACQNGHYETVKFLLDLNRQVLNSRVDTTIKQKDGFSVLHRACFKGHLEVVKLLIDVGMNLNDTTNAGYTPLYMACQNGHYETVKYLLDLNGQTLNSRVDTSIKEEDGWSVLHIACFKGHLEVVKLLIDVGMNLNDTTTINFTPLHMACQNGHYETVKYLLDLNGKTLNSRVDTTIKETDGFSVLHIACFKEHLEVVKLLIDVGMNLNDRTKNNSTPLHMACQNGHYETVKYLLDLNDKTLNSRVDTTIKLKDGWSVLHIACFEGHLEVVKLLIDVGMNLNDTTTINFTPLHMACQNGHYETVKYLLDLNGKTLNSRVDTTIKETDGFSVLHIACFEGHLEVVKLLIDVGMNLNDTTTINSTPLHMACQNGHYDIVKFFLDLNGPEINSRVDTTIKHKDGSSALHQACFNGHAEILKLLIDIGMNINERDNYGRTAVHLACLKGHGDIVKILKDNCAEVETLDSDRRTLLMCAKDKGYSDIMKLLIE